MAEAWGTPAWDIDKSVPPVIWYIRAQYVWNLKAKLSKELRK